MVFSVIVLATAFDAGCFAPEGFYAAHDRVADRATIKIFPCLTLALEGQFMATVFIGNPQIRACLFPLLAVRLDATPAHAVLGKEMCQLMPQCALDFVGGDFQKFWVEHDHALAPIRHTGCCAKGGIPKNSRLKLATSGGLQKLVRKVLQKRIVFKPGIPLWFGNIIGGGLHSPHHAATEI